MPALTLQSDHTLLLDTEHRDAEAVRLSIGTFAELAKTPGPIHHYRITPLSLWNAAASGLTAVEIIGVLKQYLKQPVPADLSQRIADETSRFGRLWVEDAAGGLVLRSDDAVLLDRLAGDPAVRALLTRRAGENAWLFDAAGRGRLKQALLRLRYPVDDRAGYRRGPLLPLALRDPHEGDFGRQVLRDYQREAVESAARAGSGVVVLPCGAGKTLVGIGLIAQQQTHTLILVPGIIAARQWARELLAYTTLGPDQIGEYSGERKETRPVTIATYQMLTQAAEAVDTLTGEMVRRPHLSVFALGEWGLIIYDEVHLLPAPVFRLVAEIQATRRLGLTATLVREDHREGEVFTLVGPKRYQAGWKALEHAGWIAEAGCTEMRIEMEAGERLAYFQARRAQQARLAGENPGKVTAVRKLAARHRDDQVLVIGHYLSQLQQIAESLKAPLISGHTPNDERSRLYDRFRRGDLKLLVVSKVANYAVDLPDANVAIQVSGTFGSRQEEAQRLGRILRPKASGTQAHFYTLVTQDTVEQEYATRRQRFLVERGYRYRIVRTYR